MFRRVLLSTLRVAAALAAIFALLWWFMIKMPGKNVSGAAGLRGEDMALRGELVADVEKLAGEIGERNIPHYSALSRAADFIEKSFSDAGLQPRRDTYN